MRFFCRNIWWIQKMVVTLHSQTGNKPNANLERVESVKKNGALVQLG